MLFFETVPEAMNFKRLAEVRFKKEYEIFDLRNFNYKTPRGKRVFCGTMAEYVAFTSDR